MPARHAILLIQDVVIILLSVLLSILMVKTGILSAVLTSAQEWKIFGSFVSGMFFTSLFTIAPAIATLGGIAHANSLFLTAAVGALGAAIGDIVIFYFVRDRFSDHLMSLIQERGLKKKLELLRLTPFFHRASFIIGGLIIASPLPDELGISLLGFSKLKMSWFIPFSFAFNFLGIILIGLAARAL